MTIDAQEYIKQTREPQNFFYSRVSTREQSQLRQVVPDCVPPENVFREVASGRDFNRPIFRDLVDNRLKDFDTLYVWSIDRFSRNLVDCLEEVKALKEIGVRIIFIDEGQTVDPREDNPAKDLFFAQLTLFGEYSRKMARRSQRQGIDAAIEADKHLPLEQRRYKGRKSKLTDDHRKKASALYTAGFSISEIARDLKLDRATIRTMLKDLGLYNKTK